jgi:hypothetical protein
VELGKEGKEKRMTVTNTEIHCISAGRRYVLKAVE